MTTITSFLEARRTPKRERKTAYMPMITIRVTDEMRRRLRIVAICQGLSLQKFCLAVFEAALAELDRKKT